MSVILTLGVSAKALWWLLKAKHERIKQSLGIHDWGTSDPFYWKREMAEQVKETMLPKSSFATLLEAADDHHLHGRGAEAMLCVRLEMNLHRSPQADFLLDRLLDDAAPLAQPPTERVWPHRHNQSPAVSNAAMGGLLLFIACLIFCSESAANWNFAGLAVNWPTPAYYLLMMAAGALAGAIIGERYWAPGVIAGVVAGVGSLALTIALLNRVDSTYSVVFSIVGMAGSSPGVGLYYLLKAIQDQRLPFGGRGRES